MQTYIALLRGINVGGHRKILMKDLRELLHTLEFKNIQTYIQSGNVVFHSKKDSKTNGIEIKDAIKGHFGFDISVIVKTDQELQDIFKDCPFQINEKEKSYFMLLDKKPDEIGLKEVLRKSFDNEKVSITNNCIYFYSAVGYGRTKFNANFFEKKLKVNATARNYKTMLKLLSMAAETQAEL